MRESLLCLAVLWVLLGGGLVYISRVREEQRQTRLLCRIGLAIACVLIAGMMLIFMAYLF